MIRPSEISSTRFVAAAELNAKGMSYSELKAAAQFGGILDRKIDPKTKRVYYKSKTKDMFHGVGDS